MRYPSSLVAACGLLTPLAAQEPALRDVPAGAPNVLVVRDVLPHLEALLASPGLRELAKATGDLQQELLGLRFDPTSLQMSLEAARPFLPERVEAACSADLMTSAALLLDAASALAISQAWLLDGAEVEEVAPLLEQAASSLAQWRAPDGVLRLTVRDAKTAERWFDQATEWLQDREDEGLAVAVEDDAVTVRLRPFALQDGHLGRWIGRLGVDTSALSDLAVAIAMARSDGEIRIRLGTFAGASLPAAELGELWREDAGQLVFARLECEAGLGIGLETLAQLDECLQELELPILRQLHGAVDRFTDLAPRVSMALDVQAGLHWTVLEDLGAEGFDFEFAPPPQELVRCLDPEAGPFSLSGLELDLLLATFVSQAYDRLMQKIGSAQLGASLEGFDDLFEYIGGEDSAVFLPGTALVVRGASFRSLDVPGAGGQRWTLGGELPFVALAVLAKSESAEAAAGFVDRLVATICKGFGAASTGVLVDADLGLGVPTRRLAFRPWLPADVVLDADLDPHHAQVGDLMILSTDPALTKALIARLKGPATRLPVENPVSWTRLTGRHVGAAVHALRRWFEALPGQAEDPARRNLVAICSALAVCSTTVDEVEWLSAHEGHGRFRTTSWLRLRGEAK